MPQTIEVSDEDVVRAGELLSAEFTDDYRSAVIKCATSADIQACPGSGKTTLLVGKLAILAEKWCWNDRGICVLSHTNVARREVERRLGKSTRGQKLLGYPHFVGTIQAFVDRFLALPCLRELGLDVSMVDNDRFATKAEALLESCYSAKGYLGRRNNGMAIVRGLRYEGPEMLLKSAAGDIPCSETARTFKELKQLKEWATNDGVFRYDDMYSYGEHYCEKHKWVIPAIQHRFPWVFVDEMQDTDALQDKMLSTLFGDDCIVQRFGDVNQAIFWGNEAEAQSTFPREGCLEVPDSKRYTSSIAGLATLLTRCSCEQTLTGRDNELERKHTIFTFDETHPERVLPAFGELLKEEFVSDKREEGFVAKAVGFRKTPPSGTTNTPYSIGHYHQSYNPKLSSQSSISDHLVEGLRKGRHLLSSGSTCKEAFDSCLNAIVEVVRLAKVEAANGQRMTASRLLDELGETSPEKELQLRQLVASSIVGREVITESMWQSMQEELADALHPMLPDGMPDETAEYLGYVEGVTPSEEAETKKENVYVHKSDEGDISIELATVHSVKGETHTATLLLETFDKTHDLKRVIKFLAGSNANMSTDSRHIKRAYVALTRPRELVCLAIRKDHISEAGKEKLAKYGWSIVEL